jgi:hypothetical protein
VYNRYIKSKEVNPMKYIIVSVATGKQVPVLDVCGEEHWEPLTMKVAAKVLTIMNREAGAKLYRAEAL